MSAPRRAPRMSLGNLRDFEALTAQFNPEQLERTVAVNYTRLGVMGHSHEQLQFQFRPNEKMSFGLDFDRHSTDTGNANAKDIESLLAAMTLPSRLAQDIAGGGPPDVLMLWPGVLEMRVRITSYKPVHKRFSADDGETTLLSVKIDVEEARTTRLYAEDVRQNGLRRGGG